MGDLAITPGLDSGMADHAPSQGKVVGEGPVLSTVFRDLSNVGQRASFMAFWS